MGIPGEERRRPLVADHLFLDQDGVPTLVEVKRSTDTRLRRELVGQMLDYAANAVVYWPVEEIRSRFIARCDGRDGPRRGDSRVPRQDGHAEASGRRSRPICRPAGSACCSWPTYPPELRRIVEFLNEQMDPAEVLALEIKQYVSGELRTLVPRIIGQTAEAESKKGSSRGPARVWDEATFFASAADKCDWRR